MHNLIPCPASLSSSSGSFKITNETIIVTPENAQIARLGKMLAGEIRKFAGLELEVKAGGMDSNTINLALTPDTQFGEEGYGLSISSDGVILRAAQPAGLFYATQTLIQLLSTLPSGDLDLPALSISDSPRFTWRGAMLDVARHFFSVEDVQRYIDLLSHYKMNRLHLHLTDDQGWRIEVKAWPKLTEVGAQTQVNGGGGGFYTQEQFKEIVDYAQSRFVMIVPEIDTPGHTNAALASYPELNCDDRAPGLYEGTEVGFSSLCIHKDITYKFLDDVVRELASLTPGPYIHIGGDEARSTPEEDFRIFIKKFQGIVYSHGKIPVGWAEIGDAELDPRTVAQHWQGAAYQGAKEQGCRVILSPANKTYLDMKYDASTPLGLDWAGHISVRDSYDWEPGSYMDKLEECDILGLETPIWTETLLTMKDIEFMAFPRLPGLAELAWTQKPQGWEEYKVRLARHGRHLEKLEINFFKSPDVDWE